jgi:hypothetical protein
MITAKEAREQTRIAESVKICQKFDFDIQRFIAQGQYKFRLRKEEMPPYGPEAFKKLGYKVEEIEEVTHVMADTGLVIRDVVAYWIKWD